MCNKHIKINIFNSDSYETHKQWERGESGRHKGIEIKMERKLVREKDEE